jgi:alpha-glucosidase
VRAFVLLLLLCAVGAAQDERRVVSPNGQVEFRLFLAQPEGGFLPRLAYLVNYQGKPLIETSFLGFDIKNQEPLLGENVGLVTSHAASEGRFNTLVAEYMQNGSLGRRIDLEIRAYDDGVAFRYRLPRSGPLDELFVRDEITEFALAKGAAIEGGGMMTMPVIASINGVGFIEIAEGKASSYPHARLEIETGTILITRLPRHADDPNLAWASSAPAVFPWRAILVATTREKLAQSPILNDLSRETK